MKAVKYRLFSLLRNTYCGTNNIFEFNIISTLVNPLYMIPIRNNIFNYSGRLSTYKYSIREKNVCTD